jgi:hypothetical protein
VTVRAGSGQAGRGEDLPLEIGPETAIADLRVELMARGAIAGEVRRDDGLPAANECVAAYDGLGALEHAQSGADGRYRIEGLRPGRYLVLPLGRVPFGPREGSGLSGDHSGLPSPLEFFSRALEVRGGETVRRDIDLGRERLPAIRGACGGLLPAAATIGYSFLHRGRPACAQGLRGDAHLEDRRFAIANLWPGPYALWIEGPDQVRLAEARVELELAETAEVTLEPPRAILVLPVEAAGGPVPASLAADAVERWSPAPTCADHEWDWEAWGGQTAMREGNALRVAGLPAGRVRVRVAARGYVPAWSEPVEIAEGSETRAPVLALDRGREIRVRLDPPEGVSLPETVQFTVRPAPAAEDAPSLPFLTERLPGEPVWVLSAFSPGDYEVRVSSEGFAEARLHAAVAADGDTELTAAFRRP